MKNQPVIILFFAFLTISLSAQSRFSGIWQGQLSREGYHWNVTLHIGESTADQQTEVYLSFPDWGMYRLPADSVSVNSDKIHFYISWMRAGVKAQLDGKTMELYLGENSKGILHRLDTAPGLFQKEEVSITREDGAVLRGTLFFPNQPPPYNAMVLTHGSGPDTRQTGPYIGKAMLAVESGLAVLAYDKRGAGASTGNGSYDIAKLSADAHAMVGHLKNHEKINPDKVGIGGISQGGWVAPKVAFENPEIAFVLLRLPLPYPRPSRTFTHWKPACRLPGSLMQRSRTQNEHCGPSTSFTVQVIPITAK